jgi:nicotinamidase/pyrazinamidase
MIFVGSTDEARRVEQVLWPAHCVQKTPGADLHRDLLRVDHAIHVYKGTNPEIDSYSAFWDNMKLSKTSLDSQLRDRLVTDVYVVGLATDVCVCKCSYFFVTREDLLLVLSVDGNARCGAYLSYGVN